MKLILLYGSPAVGKLTVANEIAKEADFRVFHNHLTIDAVKPIFDFGTESFWRLVHQFRVETVAEAARTGRNLIYTFCYAKDSDDAHVRTITKAVEENGGEIFFVLLTADKNVIEKRVAENSRKAFGKICDSALLHEMWRKYELFSTVPERESLIVDNTDLSAEATARRIVEHFRLGRESV